MNVSFISEKRTWPAIPPWEESIKAIKTKKDKRIKDPDKTWIL
jgi:hypothetical protein